METKIILTGIALIFMLLSCEKEKDKEKEQENNNPVLCEIGNQTVRAGEIKNVEISATDPDGDSLYFRITSEAAFLSLANYVRTQNGATVTMVIAPGIEIHGTFNAYIQVTDKNNSTDSESITIEVTEVSVEQNEYFPISPGAKWAYRVTFPFDCKVPYDPWFIYPDGLLASSITNGMGTWNEGQIFFEIEVLDIYSDVSGCTEWNILISSIGEKFFFYTSLYNARLQLKTDNDGTDLNIIGEMDMDSPRWVIARALARLSPDDLSQKYNISVPAGDFNNCVKATADITGDGTYVSSGTYPVEVYLAADKGIVKSVGKSKTGSIIYTMELIDSLENNEDNVMTDFDGNEYDTVNIGTQVWMKENLQVTHYSDGTPIDSVFDHPDGNDIYGRLYHWDAAMNETTTSGAQGACPTGWHIPTKEEFDELIEYVGGEDVAGGKLKATGTITEGDGLWLYPNEGATNESGFTALPAGWNFTGTGWEANFWSSTEDDETSAYRLELSYDLEGINKYGYVGAKNEAISIRCIKD